MDAVFILFLLFVDSNDVKLAAVVAPVIYHVVHDGQEVMKALAIRAVDAVNAAFQFERANLYFIIFFSPFIEYR